jgi:hypothetical protein
MDLNSRIKIKEQELIHGKGLTIFELADKLNKSYSYLCRIASPTEELPFPLEIALPAMKLKKNYGLLELMAWECGFALVKLPKTAATKKDENELAASYQKAVSEAVSAVIHFFEESSNNNYKNVTEKIQTAVSESLTVKKYCDKKASKQLELAL